MPHHILYFHGYRKIGWFLVFKHNTSDLQKEHQSKAFSPVFFARSASKKQFLRAEVESTENEWPIFQFETCVSKE
ncbi:MAG: hypothetical protein ACI8RD_001012 [Bacillariaceae sp.]|jgi:hypothetical protein